MLTLFNAGCHPESTALPLPTVRPIRTWTAGSAAPYNPSHAPPAGSSASDTAWGWTPSPQVEDLSRWKGIIIHHSATDDGNADEFNQAHRERGWDGLGYHFVIDNGRGGTDGKIEVGYRWRNQLTGAHCRPKNASDNYWNEQTIGICLVGNFNKQRPSPAQWRSLLELVRFLQDRYHIPTNRIMGHRDVEGAKTDCPGRNLSLPKLRREL